LQHLGAIATLVPQDPEIFESSIGNNVTMGLDRTPSEVHRACDLARLTPVIEGLPEGLETEISERGVNLSGGQKQRLALARGILASRGSSLIMLDEPTSSLDATTEVALYRNLLAEIPDACVVSSIHRLHLLPMFDVVVLLAEGRIVDQGSMAELLDRQPSFNAMWRSYAGAAVEGAGSENQVPVSGSAALAA
jgi:ABC-type multidrug transport system fused ATPase/permease subunit